MPPTSPWSGIRGASFPVQPPNQWLPTSTDTTYQQQHGGETSLSSVSSWFHPGLLPPPQIPVLPQQPSMMPPMTMNRRARSPSPNFYSGSPFPVRPDADGSESFQPIHTPLDPQSVSSPVDLQVSNLDHGLDPKEMRRRLIAAFKEHVMVLQLSVYTQADGQMSARVRVASRQDAQVAVATLQRQVVGNRRIRISVASQGNRAGSVSPCAQLVRAQVAALLKEVPSHRLPLFQLCELYEKRFLSTVSLSELNRMRDLVSIMEEAGSGRMVTLLPESRRSITPSFSDMAYAALQEGQMPELPYCPIHALGENAGAGWAEKTLQPLPNVVMSLPALSKGLFSLLNSHQGALPLYSLPLCYEAEVCQLRVDEKGVPLEHLVTWVRGVVLKSSPNGGCAKMLTWGSHSCSNGSHPPSSSTSEDSNNCCDERATSPAQLAAQVTLFGREVVELLRASPRCQISFIKFIPAYHHHFGRQCRVANYGYTRLIELLEALPNVVQVIGEGDSRLVVLAQPAQIRRFTSDLLRVLKTQPNKQAYLVELPELFTKCLNRNFDPTEYGLCDIADLVSRVPKNTVVLSPPLGEDSSPQQSTILALPKREQTPDEMERTRHFALELVSLLRDAPQCYIPFNKFIPAYHHHFGHQCRLADYGVTKLAELLSAVSDVAQVEECPGGERRIVLSLPERQRVLGEQVNALVAATHGGTLLLSQLSMAYQRQHGVALDPPTYGAATTFELVQRLSNWVSVSTSDRGPVLHPVSMQHSLSLRLLTLLTNVPNHRMSLSQLVRQLETKFQQRVNQGDLKLLQHMVQLSRGEVALTPLYAVAARIRAVLLKQGGSCLLGGLLSLYMVYWGFPLNPADFNHTSLVNLLSELSEIFQLTGKGKKRTVVLAETQQGSSNASSTPVPIPSALMVHSQPPMKTSTRDTISSTGPNDQEKVLWGHILPNPAIQPPLPPQQTTETVPNATSAVWDNKLLNSPWIGQPWGLQTQHSIAENMWSESTPIKLWSPPKAMGIMMAPDPSELPMPSGSLLEHLATQDNEEQSTTLDSTPNKLSDSGIGQASPTSPQLARRPNRLAANFSSPIELL
ncbi:hypothetical protein B566_EDAN004322 [Ephemera danica]|nr:hypothetical protein B566_EDAN004322 [Ephemera danica]